MLVSMHHPRSLALALALALTLLAAAVTTGGCAVTSHPAAVWAPEKAPTALPAPRTWAEALSGPVTLHFEPVLSARWQVERAGLINLDNPAAADQPHDELPIVLPVHVLTHPTAGLFIVDTGISSALAQQQRTGERVEASAIGWPLTVLLEKLEPVEPLADILARQTDAEGAQRPLAGVLFTHLHVDHILGLPDVPADTPLYTGVGEATATGAMNLAVRGTNDALFAGHAAFREIDSTAGVTIGDVAHAVDFFGDGSLWVIPAPGHTPGSLAYVANTDQGPVLFTGDTSHTRWGFVHDVEPGSFTADHAANKQALGALRSIARDVEGLQVYTGHDWAPVQLDDVVDAPAGVPAP